MSDVARRAHDPGEADAPTLLHHPPGAKAPLPPVRHGEELTAVHRAWADAHAAEHPPDHAAGRAGLDAVKARARARLASAAAAAMPDRGPRDAVVGDLIRAVDALASRVDELGGRLVALEELVEEVVVVTSEDLTRVRAAVAGRGTRSSAAERRRGPAAGG
ncbi:MAG: hypothetical protein ACRDZR_19175 [Acidimicrobiales bacterium]